MFLRLHVHPQPWCMLLLETVIPWSKCPRSGNPEQRKCLDILASTTWKRCQYPSWYQMITRTERSKFLTAALQRHDYIVDWPMISHLYALLQKCLFEDTITILNSHSSISYTWGLFHNSLLSHAHCTLRHLVYPNLEERINTECTWCSLIVMIRALVSAHRNPHNTYLLLSLRRQFI